MCLFICWRRLSRLHARISQRRCPQPAGLCCLARSMTLPCCAVHASALSARIAPAERLSGAERSVTLQCVLLGVGVRSYCAGIASVKCRRTQHG
jgi:hypothetical protein